MPTKIPTNHYWSTKNELTYIDKLVDGSVFEKRASNIPTEQLLRNYIKSAKMRKRLGTFGENIDVNEVILYAQRQLLRFE